MEKKRNFTIITNCHPGEKVGRQVGLNVANRLRIDGERVTIVEMSERFEDENGNSIPWWQAWENEYTCLTRREMEEEAIAEAQPPGTLTLSFHDGINSQELGRLFETDPGNVRGEIEDLRTIKGFMGIEIGTQSKPSKNPERRKIARELRLRRTETSKRTAHYVEMESDLADPENQDVLAGNFTQQIVRGIKDILKGKPPDRITTYFDLEFRHHKLSNPNG
jgi:hypothetical protein